jgi:hypothetical protein
VQHGLLEVKLLHNAMESFQQKVPPILLGAFKDIFDRKEEETTQGSYRLLVTKIKDFSKTICRKLRTWTSQNEVYIMIKMTLFCL